MTILQSIVILQTPLAANDTNQEFLAEIQVRLKKKWNCQTQGHLIPQYMRQILREHRKLHTTEMQRTFRLTWGKCKGRRKKNDKIEKIFFV